MRGLMPCKLARLVGCGDVNLLRAKIIIIKVIDKQPFSKNEYLLLPLYFVTASQLIFHFVTGAPVAAKANTCNGFHGFLIFVTVSQLRKHGLGVYKRKVENCSVHIHLPACFLSLV